MKVTPEFLAKRKAAIRADLLLKVEVEDWHGVADCCMDLREVEAMLKVLPIRESAQPCGCDPGADWICEMHRPRVFADLIRTD